MEKKEEVIDEYNKKNEISIMLITVCIIIFSFLFLFFINKNNQIIKKDDTYFGKSNKNEYNAQFEKYFGMHVSGKKVIELLDKIMLNNTNYKDNIIGIDPNYTDLNGQKVTGQNNCDVIYIENEIKNTIDKEKKYIVKATSMSTAYSDIGYIRRTTIADESKLSEKDVKKYNSNYEEYFGEHVQGTKVKEMIEKIKRFDEQQYKEEKDKFIRILFNITPNFTKDNETYYLLTGVNKAIFSKGNYLEEYLDIIIDDKFYFVDGHEYNPDGTIYQVVVADELTKDEYIK